MTVKYSGLGFSDFGVIIRASSKQARQNMGGYYVTISAHQFDGDPHLVLAHDVSDSNAANWTALVSDEAAVSTNTDYRLRIEAYGPVINASLWDATGTTQLSSVSYSDATEEDGYFGLRAAFGNNNRSYYFSDLTVIPEPGTAALLLLGGLLVGLRRTLRVHQA